MGSFTVCVPDPRTGGCQYPYHDPDQVNGGAQHNADSAQADMDGGRMDGFVAHGGTPRRPRMRPDAHRSASRPRRPTSWATTTPARSPTTGAGRTTSRSRTTCSSRPPRGACRQHLFMVSGWSAHCTRGGDPSSCVNDDELGGFKTGQISQGRSAGGTAGDAPRRCGRSRAASSRHGIRREPYGLDLRQPHERRRAGPVPPPGSAGQGRAAEPVRELRLDRPDLAAPSQGRELGLLHRTAGSHPSREARRRRSGTRCPPSPPSAATGRRAT